jgi:hypothetical protein
MDRALNWIALRRHIPLVAWLVGILLVLLGFWCRGSSSGLVAVRDMAANHAITATDLKTSETAALVAHYLRQSVKAGDPITPSMVSGQPLPTNDNSIAAVVRIPAAMKIKRGIEVGSFVLIYVGRRAVWTARPRHPGELRRADLLGRRKLTEDAGPDNRSRFGSQRRPGTGGNPITCCIRTLAKKGG